MQVCKKLDVEYGGEYRTKASVKPFVQELLTPLNCGLLNPQSTMLVSEFVDKVYLQEYVEKNLRAATKKQYTDVWENHLKLRMGKLTLRGFRTVHAEQMLARIAAQAGLGRSSLRHCKAFLSGAFKQAKRLGVLDGLNPIMDVSIPRVPEAEEDTYAYSLSGIKTMRRDVWVGLKPTERLRASRGRRSRGQQRARKTTLRSERRSTLKKSLTEPTLLEMYGKRCQSGTFAAWVMIFIDSLLVDFQQSLCV